LKGKKKSSLKCKTKLIYQKKRNPYQSLLFSSPPDCDGKMKQLKQNQKVFISLLGALRLKDTGVVTLTN